MARRTRTSTEILQVKVTLNGIRPLIWRHLLVRSDMTLARLHFALQEAMGWTNSHLHMFVIGDRRIGDLRQDEGELGLEDERKVKLGELIGPGQSLTYEYDFGDGWIHEVKVEKGLERDERLHYPLCVGGARACPPEDVGGDGGYEDFLAALADPDHERHDDYVSWAGGVFDPEGFDLNAVNRALRGLR